jgi:hypothetical protein
MTRPWFETGPPQWEASAAELNSLTTVIIQAYVRLFLKLFEVIVNPYALKLRETVTPKLTWEFTTPEWCIKSTNSYSCKPRYTYSKRLEHFPYSHNKIPEIFCRLQLQFPSYRLYKISYWDFGLSSL